MQHCELCQTDGGIILLQNSLVRIVLAQNEADYPCLCRVILNQHVKEMTDLPAETRIELMEWVWRTERALRELLQPDKINLACLGNQVPHVHWHIIPRFNDDTHFPAPIWATRVREGIRHSLDDLATQLRQKLTDSE